MADEKKVQGNESKRHVAQLAEVPSYLASYVSKVAQELDEKVSEFMECDY